MAWLRNEVRYLLDKRVQDETVLGKARSAAESGVTFDLMLDASDEERWQMVAAQIDGVRAAVLRIAEEVEVLHDFAHHRLDNHPAPGDTNDSEH